MKLLLDNDFIWRRYDEKILFISYVDAPGLCMNYITSHPDYWVSAILEQLMGMNFVAFRAKVIGTAWDNEGGPIVLCETTLRQVLDITIFDNKLKYGISSICATIFWVPKTIGRITVCDQTEISNLELMEDGGGCNPAGSLYFPQAPIYSKNLAKHRGLKIVNNTWADNDPNEAFKIFQERVRIDETKTKLHFPNIDFSCNKILDLIALNFEFQRSCRQVVARERNTLQENYIAK